MDETISEFSNYGTEFYQTIIETAKQLIRCNVNQSDVNQSTTINFNNSNMYTDDDCSVESQSTTDETLQVGNYSIITIAMLYLLTIL